MRVPDHLLDEEGKRIAKRGGLRIRFVLYSCVLSFIGLLLYMAIAPGPNVTLIEIWFAGTTAAVAFGISTINRHLNRTLPSHQIPDNANNRTADSN